jgi:2-octaprenyl-6-methoxyphenol hydroxylase
MTYDIAIVGGGMVGAALGVALAPLGLRVALIESLPPDAAAQPSFDERTTALSNGSRRILETLGVWPEVSAIATPIRKIHVSEQGRFGFARIDAEEQNLDALGYVVPNRALGSALWARLARGGKHSGGKDSGGKDSARAQGADGAGGVDLFCPARVSEVRTEDGVVSLGIIEGNGNGEAGGKGEGAGKGAGKGEGGVARTIAARLIVAADGMQSVVRKTLGVNAQVRDYGQTAVITTVLPQRFHDYVAYERFTPEGPLALLPLEGGRCTLVLTLNTAFAHSAMAWSDQEFLAEVQRRFGFRLGRLMKLGRRAAYPLALSRAARTSEGRCVIIGNAAQTLHPVAGMGFNLGLRDVASLAELIADAAGSPDFDPGRPALLAEYDAWRAADRRGVIAFTDALIRVFGNPLALVRQLRGLSLLAFDVLPPAKSALSRLSTGGGGRVPKLARGVALRRGMLNRGAFT